MAELIRMEMVELIPIEMVELIPIEMVELIPIEMLELIRILLEMTGIHGKIRISITKELGGLYGQIFGGFQIGSFAGIQSNC